MRKSSKKCEDISVRVCVHEARALLGKDDTGYSDPYCILTFGKACPTARTKTIDQNLNPVWQESFVLKGTSKDSLIIDCFDEDEDGSDDFLGRVIFSGAELAEYRAFTFSEACKRTTPEHAQWHNVVGRSKRSHVAGRILISAARLTYTSPEEPEENEDKAERSRTSSVRSRSSTSTSRLPSTSTEDAAAAAAADAGNAALPASTRPSSDTAPSSPAQRIEASKSKGESSLLRGLSWKRSGSSDSSKSAETPASATLAADSPPSTPKSSEDKLSVFEKNARNLREKRDNREKAAQGSTGFWGQGVGRGPSKDDDKCLRAGAGILTVTLHEARGLLAKDACGTSDPYCTLDMGRGPCRRSRCIDKCLEPKWGEQLLLAIQPGSQHLLTLDIFDKDDKMFGTDDFLGRVVFPLQAMQWEGRAGRSAARAVFIRIVGWPLQSIAACPTEGCCLYAGT
ncbi:hypothetical protein CYMTET_46095 [Cymbomonas tetramitiformis]|uniref:C2 domain-containing protein n=1 Tax=Cymbomonas tetramitiformis TaxID=36881 RepID=A0AAE0EXX8_9CHLO|nr:hypothetical protein CYMTET_46095 [Cymbomonas tetramitiformis]